MGIFYVLVAASTSADPSSASRTPLGEAAISFIQRAVQTSAASPAFPPLALAAAFLLGGLHALTPGHNKTLVGAYLVGARARLRHAVLIGAATAFSHTASAIVIGMLALSTTGQIATAQYLRWIGLPSGILTVCLGVWLLRSHFKGSNGGFQPHDHNHSHLHDHPHDHDYPHHYPAPDGVTLGGLIALGLVHGIVPTFDALAIILVALNVQQAGLGVGLIFTYSLGIGGVMIAVGALFIRAQKLLLDNHRFERFSRWSPALGASVFTLLGLWLVVRTLVALG
jgi:nickel/cobalt transporter (NicO) family protein